MRIEDVIGQRITRAREETGWSQAEIGVKLGGYLGKPWPRQAVSAAEKGRRAFTAAELVALAYVLGYSVETLLSPPDGVSEVTLADGRPIAAQRLRAWAVSTSDEKLASLVETIASIRDEVPVLMASAARTDDLILDAVQEVLAAVRAQGLEISKDLMDRLLIHPIERGEED